jgi:hypothetical protein
VRNGGEQAFYLLCARVYISGRMVSIGDKPGMLQIQSYEQAGCRALHAYHSLYVRRNGVKILAAAYMVS